MKWMKIACIVLIIWFVLSMAPVVFILMSDPEISASIAAAFDFTAGGETRLHIIVSILLGGVVAFTIGTSMVDNIHKMYRKELSNTPYPYKDMSTVSLTRNDQKLVWRHHVKR